MSVAELKERHLAATETVNALTERLKQKRLLLLDTDVVGFARSQRNTPGLDDDAAPQVRKLYGELVELWSNGATMGLNALYVEQKIGRGHCTAGIRSQYEPNDPQDLYIMIMYNFFSTQLSRALSQIYQIRLT